MRTQRSLSNRKAAELPTPAQLILSMMDRVLIEEKGWKSLQLFADMRNPKTSWYACPCPSSPTQATDVPCYMSEGVHVCVLDLTHLTQAVGWVVAVRFARFLQLPRWEVNQKGLSWKCLMADYVPLQCSNVSDK